MNQRIQITGLFLFFLAAALLLSLLGAERLNLPEVLQGLRGGATPDSRIFFHIRLPRVFLALMAGGTLGMAGAALQILFRNPLAEPWTMGIAGGAGVGAFIAKVTPVLIPFGFFQTTQLYALLGAAASLLLVLSLNRREGTGGSQTSVLLLGLTISVISAGIVMVVNGLISPWKLAEYQRWILGGLHAADWSQVMALCVLAVPGLVMLLLQSPAYNPLSLGEEMAAGQGVDLARLRRWTLLGAGLASAAVASVAGPIGFVGLLAPHIIRRLIGSDARVVLPYSFLLGGILLAGCDTLGRWVHPPYEIPAGAITAILGGPVFLYILLRRSGPTPPK